MYILIAISIGLGWFAWSIRGPKVQTVITWANGQLAIKGRVSPHQKQEMQEYFASRFADVPHLKVTILAQSRSIPNRPRIQIRSVTAADDAQSIRNILASRLS